MIENNIVYVLIGVVIGYCVWNILHIIRTEKKMNKFNTLVDSLKDINKKESKEGDPILIAHHTLVDVLNFPKSKAVLYKNNTALAIAYGHSCVVIIERPRPSAISIGLGIDKTTEQTKEERDEEFKQLKELLESCNFNEDNFSGSLALLVTALSRAESEKFSEVCRQISRDML